MKPKRLETGYTLTQENFNSIVDMISKLENKEVLINDDTMSFIEGDDFAGSLVSINRDNLGRIESITQEIKETTDRTPFRTFNGGLSFEHELVYNVDNSADFQVLRKDNGTIISSTNFSLNNRGVISFGTEHDEEFVLVSGLDYWITKTMYIGRDNEGNIVKLSMTPIERVVERVEQDLIPVLLSNRDEVDIDAFMYESNSTQNPPKRDIRFHRRFNTPKGFGLSAGNAFGTYLDTLKINFKQKLEPSKIIIESQLNSSDKPLYSFDVWGSNDNTTWERALRIRNITKDDRVKGSNLFVFEIANVQGYQYLRFDNLSQDRLRIDSIQILGYHPDGFDMRNSDRLLGQTFTSSMGDYNGSIRLTSDDVQTTFTDNMRQEITAANPDHARPFRMLPGNHLIVEFNERMILESYKFARVSNLQNWRLEGSIDGVNYEIIDQREQYDWTVWDEFSNHISYIYPIDKPRPFRFYRLYGENRSGSPILIYGLELAGRRR